MSETSHFNPPEITDEDIRWAARLLGLPENAFHGKNGDDPRRDVLRCMDSTDIAACPGSGKTTLLVAKLAILVNKWEHRTRGICVLSHTNAARREIEERLGCTAVGRQLLSYPHYIGTIHGFVDGFLALPWLRSQGYPITMISTEICLERRWNSLPFRTRKGLESNHHNRSVLTIKSPAFDVGEVRWARGHLGTDSDTYRHMKKVCKQSAVEGFFCYNEMFIWADTCLDNLPELVRIIRERFPVLFIDESQDNSEEQSKILHRVFMDGGSYVLRQRFGDSNQAIYNSFNDKDASTDAFPSNDMKKSVPNSHRFGPTIAKLAEPLGVVPHDGGLTGNGPRPICSESHTTKETHTIFLFQDDTIDKVLPAYADLLIETFSEEELKHGVFTAVGQVHNDTGDGHRPRHVGYYWPDYDSELSKANPQPQTFVQYVRAGQEQAETTGETYPGVEKIAQGILRLVGMAEGGRAVRTRRRSHRYVLELLEEEKTASNLYHLLISQMIVKRIALTKRKWNRCWVECIRKIGEKVAEASLTSVDANAFLEWRDTDGLDADGHEKAHSDNVFHYPEDDPKIHIKLGSIHSVKGQTHTATLVLETFWHDHNLESLKEWLMGTRCNGSNLGVRDTCRLKLHYVAMTRPTHLLCLAMKRSSLEDSNGETYINTLQEYGWNIKCV